MPGGDCASYEIELPKNWEGLLNGTITPDVQKDPETGDGYYNPNYTPGSSTNGNTFLGWMNADGAIVSTTETYTFNWDIPESVGTLSLVGLIIFDANDYNADTFYHGSGDSKVFDRGLSGQAAKGTYGIGKTGSLYGHTYYACTWAQYVDAVTGETVTVYSDMITVEKFA